MHIVLIIFLLLIVVFIVYKLFYTSKKSSFWINQPVSRPGIQMKHGPIVSKQKIYNNLVPDPSVNHLNEYNLNKLLALLNEHYFEGLTYNENYVKWHILDHGVGFLNDQGSICSVPIQLYIDGKIQTFTYVDYLLLKKGVRGQLKAPQLISKIIRNSLDNGIDKFIFRIEQNQLPFQHVCKLNSCYGKIPSNLKINNQIVIKKGINNDVYQFWKQYAIKHKIALMYDYSRFSHMCIGSEVTKCYVAYNGNQIVGLIIYFITLFKGEPVAEISCLIGSDQVADMLVSKIKEPWMVMHNMSNHKRWIDRYGLIMSHNSWVYFYNYYHNEIKPHELFFGVG